MSRRSDPGPTRWGYRLRRKWANPAVRGFVRGYLPLIVLGLVGWGVVSQDSVRLAAVARAEAAVEWLAARQEFAVEGLEITGATPSLAADIRRQVGDPTGSSSLSLDLAALRAEIEAMPAVARARLYFEPHGKLILSVDRREPVALWRDGDGRLTLIDGQGVVIRPVSARLLYPDLPLVLGTGAPGATAEALRLLDAAPGLGRQIRGVVRVGERRWDLVLATQGEDLTIMLPERDAVPALSGLMAVHRATGLFDRDLVAVDLRNTDRPVLRLSPRAAEGLIVRRAVNRLAGEDT